MKQTPLSEIEDTVEFPFGTKFRQYGIGLNVKTLEEDYYEYMLAHIPGDQSYLLLTCVAGYKSGHSLALVSKAGSKNNYCVTAKALKFSMGIEKVFLLET